MKLGIASTTLLITIGLATPVRAEVQCRQSSAFRICIDETNWHSDRRIDNYADDYADINQIYREVLGRDADSNGLRTYSRKLDRGQSLRDIRTNIAESREARDVIKRTYRELVGRSANRSTLRDYTRSLARGWTLHDVRADIVGSDEFKSRVLTRKRGASP